MTVTPPPDVIVVVPPLSPSDTNPPLGPYLLKACAEKAGIRLDVADLSVQHLNRFKNQSSTQTTRVLGDQDKDRSATHAARDHVRAICPLATAPTLHLPDSADPILGMHYSFESIESAVAAACEPTSEFWQLIEEDLVARYPVPPRVLGLSIMGPPQVFLALVIARLVKQRWPGTRVVAGGSHVTLLADDIAADSRYGGDIDLYMPGHCETQFVELVQHILRHGSLPLGVGLRAGAGRRPSCDKAIAPTVNGRPRIFTSTFEYKPSLDRRALRLYDPQRVTLPMQLTRGCAFGQCSYCTYPAVEPSVDIEPDWPRVTKVIAELIEATGVRRFSFKDSLFTAKNLRTLARVLVDAELNIEWSATTLLNKTLTPDFLEALYCSGCRTLEFGLETIDPVGQRLFGKALDLAMCEQVISAGANAGIAVVINQILGWPGQTLASAESQMEWYESLRSQSPELVRASFNLLEINRASPMATDPAKYGIALAGIA
ncbi:MAG: hypothetical protein KJZ54_16135, partial [Phycisphaerales bacterium]|nr:hypothetical protein [Phycisphaerales bacterium]